MNLLDEFVSLPLLIDIALGLSLLEVVALVAYHRVTGRGVALHQFGLNLLSGLCLMVALRSVVRDSGAAWAAIFLLAAGLAHGADIVLRWRRTPSPAAAGPSPRRHLAADGPITSGAGVSR